MNRWYVAETKWRCEAEAVDQLQRQDFEAIYPALCIARVVRGQKTEIIKPLFFNYVFVAFDIQSDHWKRICSTRGVKRLFGGISPLPLPVGEAERLVSRCAEGPLSEEEFTGLVVGALVRLEDGPLCGFQGRVGRLTDAGRVQVLVNLFGRTTPIFAERRHLCVLDGP